MSLLHYIDNEVPDFGEWDAKVEAGSSTILRSALASFPERGSYGLRTTLVGTSVAYVRKIFSSPCPIAAGGDMYLGFWHRCINPPASGAAPIMSLYSSLGGYTTMLYWTSTQLRVYVKMDSGASTTANWTAGAGRWYYVVLRLHRAATAVSADGYAALYVNGVQVAKTSLVDNYDYAIDTARLYCGSQWDIKDGFTYDNDEIKLGDTLADVEPYRPAPATEYVEAARTLVLYRQASADSVAFADYCVTQLGIPRANLVPLPNATGDETLANYAAFQTQVENDLAAWLAANPTADADKMCFIIGYGVPGYFTDGAIKVSATSRLMSYGIAYTSGGKANPLSSTGVPPVRITKTILDAAAAMLAVRIDCATLSSAQNILAAGLTVSALDRLADTDVLYSSDADYLDSLGCQKLRLLTSGNLTILTNAAFFYGSSAGSLFASGSRAAYAGTGWGSADSLRELTNQLYQALRYYGWAAGVGWAYQPDEFDAESFFEMLRIGGTFAEAAAVAIASVDYTAVVAGEPFMTVSFPKHGHNIYKGIGGVESIDWSSPVACLRQDQTLAILKTTLTAGRRHIYAARAVSEAGIEENGILATTFIEIDGQGTMLPPPLSAPFELTAAMQSDGSLLVSFSHETGGGENEPESFELLSDFGTGEIDTENPAATLSDISSGQSDFEILVVTPTLPAMFAVRGICDGQAGPLSEIIFVQAPPSPQPPTLF